MTRVAQAFGRTRRHGIEGPGVHDERVIAVGEARGCPHGHRPGVIGNELFGDGVIPRQGECAGFAKRYPVHVVTTMHVVDGLSVEEHRITDRGV